MKSQHTSGPWAAEKHPLGHYGIFQRDYAHQVAEVLARNTSPEMVEANARLIAAAPDLLHALKLLLGCVLMGGDPYDSAGQQGSSPISIARETVAKAGGCDCENNRPLPVDDLRIHRENHRCHMLDCLKDGHPNPEGYMEWYDGLTDDEWSKKFSLVHKPATADDSGYYPNCPNRADCYLSGRCWPVKDHQSGT